MKPCLAAELLQGHSERFSGTHNFLLLAVVLLWLCFPSNEIPEGHCHSGVQAVLGPCAYAMIFVKHVVLGAATLSVPLQATQMCLHKLKCNILTKHCRTEQPYGGEPVSGFQKAIRGGETFLKDHICKTMNALNMRRCALVPRNTPGADWRAIVLHVREHPEDETYMVSSLKRFPSQADVCQVEAVVIEPDQFVC
jgi:hypothetical protein